MKKAAASILLAGLVVMAGCSHPAPYPPPPPPPVANSIAQQGFHDGYEAARHDVATGRPPSFERHPRFRNPPVPPPAFGEYRAAFRNGYESFLHQAPPPPPPNG